MELVRDLPYGQWPGGTHYTGCSHPRAWAHCANIWTPVFSGTAAQLSPTWALLSPSPLGEAVLSSPTLQASESVVVNVPSCTGATHRDKVTHNPLPAAHSPPACLVPRRLHHAWQREQQRLRRKEVPVQGGQGPGLQDLPRPSGAEGSGGASKAGPKASMSITSQAQL